MFLFRAMIPYKLLRGVADSTPAVDASATCSPIGIRLVVGVAVFAVSLCAVLHDSAPNVFSLRNGFQVVRIDAGSNAAKMVELQALWDWTHEQFISETMGGLKRPLGHYHAIPVAIQAAHPNPATGLGENLYVAHELVNNRLVSKLITRHVIPPRIASFRAAQRMRSVVAACFYYRPSQYQEFQKLNKI